MSEMSEHDSQHTSTAPALTEAPTATDPSALGGQKKQLDETELKALSELKKDVAQRTAETIALQKESLYKQVGGAAGAADGDPVWDRLRQGSDADSNRQVSHALSENLTSLRKPANERDPFDQVFVDVAGDHWGGTEVNFRMRAPQVANFETGHHLAKLATDERDPDQLKKATDTIRLLIRYGAHKLHSFNSTGQLDAALDVAAVYAQQIPDFNIAEAGIDEAYTTLTGAAAAAEIDYEHHPNMRRDNPSDRIDTSLDKLYEVVAQHKLHDVRQGEVA